MYLLQKHFIGEGYRVVVGKDAILAYFKTYALFYPDIEGFKSDLESIGLKLLNIEEFAYDEWISVEIKIGRKNGKEGD